MVFLGNIRATRAVTSPVVSLFLGISTAHGRKSNTAVNVLPLSPAAHL